MIKYNTTCLTTVCDLCVFGAEKSAVFVSVYNQHSKMAAVLANYVFERIAVYLTCCARDNLPFIEL